MTALTCKTTAANPEYNKLTKMLHSLYSKGENKHYKQRFCFSNFNIKLHFEVQE